MDKRLLSLSSRKVEKILKKLGFELDRQSGSHKQYVRITDDRKFLVTVIANKKRFAPKTLRSIIRQSGFQEKDWLEQL